MSINLRIHDRTQHILAVRLNKDSPAWQNERRITACPMRCCWDEQRHRQRIMRNRINRHVDSLVTPLSPVTRAFFALDACPSLPHVPNGEVQLFCRGQKALYICNKGYVLQGGSEVRRCRSQDREWSGTAPECVPECKLTYNTIDRSGFTFTFV